MSATTPAVPAPLGSRTLGANGPPVGAIGLGCMPLSFAYVDAPSDDDPTALVHRAIDLGVTFFDTADVYGPFTNEQVVGDALRGRRDEVALATKVGLEVGPNGGYPLSNDARPGRIATEIDASLRRLRTDRVDLYYLHRVDPEVPLEDTWGALAELVRQGKVGAIGLCEVDVEQLERAHAIHPVAAVQSELSLWTRDALPAVAPWCAANGAAFVPFSPLGRGFLTGTITDASFDASDFRSRNPRFTAEAVDANQAVVAAVRSIADRIGATPAQVAIAWTLAQGEHVIPIPGTKRIRYLQENVAAADLELGRTELDELDALPEASGTRY
jgi:aryl-alcohol dehydrogenase-like predicted oxidoreductase